MRLLLDSHVLLWYDERERLRPSIRQQIDASDAALLSVISIWELTLKRSLGKLPGISSIRAYAAESGFRLLNITPEHAELAGSLPLHHRDPFDRMLVAQAVVEELTLVTHDRTLQQYGIPILLA